MVLPANHDLQSVDNYGKTHANHSKSVQIRLQIKMSFPTLCKARANHDLHLDLQLANHDLQSANHTMIPKGSLKGVICGAKHRSWKGKGGQLCQKGVRMCLLGRFWLHVGVI